MTERLCRKGMISPTKLEKGLIYISGNYVRKYTMYKSLKAGIAKSI
jgi:hypothetical protein